MNSRLAGKNRWLSKRQSRERQLAGRIEPPKTADDHDQPGLRCLQPMESGGACQQDNQGGKDRYPEQRHTTSSAPKLIRSRYVLGGTETAPA